MSSIIGNTKDLNAGQAELLRGLLGSLGRCRTGDNSSEDAPLSTEQLQKLSQKIDEVLGDGADGPRSPGNQPSQLLNEDGLPIIDISEPVDDTSHTSSFVPLSVQEQDLIPLSLLSSDERERRRRERDNILDLLEQEERLQQLREDRDAEEERKEAIRKRKESVRAELEQLKAAQELQKKMGRALVQRTKETEGNRKEEALQTKPSVTKKCVSFAEAPTKEEEAGAQRFDWGDVVPGRLRANTHIPLVSTTQAQEYPVKMQVVERHPAANLDSPRSADSDDESASSTGHPQYESSEEEEGSLLSSNNLSEEEPLEEEFDYDIAQHHREIALEYHQKRQAIGAETAKAMAGSINSKQHEAPNGQTPVSRFRADRMAAAYDRSHSPVSTSVGTSVIPASRQKSLRKSVRLGKLENDKLVGGHSGESGSEDETTREVIQMLKEGSIQNAGPDFHGYSISTVELPENSGVPESSTGTSNTVFHRAKPSRFKLAHGGGTAATTNIHGEHGGQLQPAVSRVIERKAPRSTSSFRIYKPSQRPSAEVPEQASPMIVDSPSFPMPANGSSTLSVSSNRTTTGTTHNPTRPACPPLVKTENPVLGQRRKTYLPT